jgi:hypothetical protein
MKKTLLLIVALLMFAGIAYAEERCANCMMKVFDDSPYRISATFEDGTVKPLCSLFCGSIERERAEGATVELTVVDYNTGETLRAEDAVWVEGSDIRAMMSDEPRVAFKDTASAEAFVREHGGNIVSFEDVYQHSVNEWKR